MVEGRAKTVSSFEEKIKRDGKSYRNPLSEVTDLAGLRIILYYVSDVDRVSDLIKREFRIDKLRSIDKRKSLAVDQFGYLSIHWIVRISKARGSLPEWAELRKLVAEIQVRTVVQHSWAAISHTLQYKHENESPPTFRRRLVRLAGLLELADDEFEGLRVEQDRLRERAAESITEGKLRIPLDAYSVAEYLATSMIVAQLITQATSAGIAVVGEDDPDYQASSISQLLAACKFGKLETVSELNDLLESTEGWTAKFFRSFISLHVGRNPELVRSSAGDLPIRGTAEHITAMVVMGVAAPRTPAPKIESEMGWDLEYARDVLSAAHKALKVAGH